MKRWLLAALAAFAVGLTLAVTLAWIAVTQPVALDPSPSCIVTDVDPGRLRSHVMQIADPSSPRDYSHPRNLDETARYIHQALQEHSLEVFDQPYIVNGIGFRNVVAGFGPREGPRVVIGAHYDVAGPRPGADDNASGVAGLLELARALGATAPSSRVELVAYTLEEPPFFRTPHMGSAVHARSLRASGASVRAMISLEMIGFFTEERESQHFPLAALRYVYPRTGNFIAVVGKIGQWETVRRIKLAMRKASDLPVYSINAPVWMPGIDFSDHLNYWAAGYPAVMITDTAFYRNDRYHTPRDTQDSLDYEQMAKVVQGVYCAIQALGPT
jgi:hypothetical protein